MIDFLQKFLPDGPWCSFCRILPRIATWTRRFCRPPQLRHECEAGNVLELGLVLHLLPRILQRDLLGEVRRHSATDFGIRLVGLSNFYQPCLAAGAFLYIALVGMLPLIQKQDPNWARFFCQQGGLISGALIMYLIAIYTDEMVHVFDWNWLFWKPDNIDAVYWWIHFNKYKVWNL